jgi:hypothetical protein
MGIFGAIFLLLVLGGLLAGGYVFLSKLNAATKVAPLVDLPHSRWTATGTSS